MPVMKQSPKDAPYWTHTNDGWSYYVKPSSFEHRQGQWYALIQRANGEKFHEVTSSNSFDMVNHQSDWFPTEQEARVWCITRIQAHRAVKLRRE